MELTPNGTTLRGDDAGAGPAVVLLHGLTATRRHVLSGSRFLERSGHRVVAYDARGHGASDPASSYAYPEQVADLAGLIEERGLERPVLVGQSMGAAAAMAYALAEPGRVGGLVQITPAYDGAPQPDPRWERLAEGLERAGVDGFMAAYEPKVDLRYREVVETFTRQRLSRHSHPDAVAAALREVPRSTAFEGLNGLEALDLPVLIIATRDDADPEHPLAVAEVYAERLPRSELHVDPPGESPLAWRGARLSKRIAAWMEGPQA
ncbi:MAG: alpha/beta fold hydrolase [Thermoleophilaceae bacterium]|nr:alpha/beta fold hydrolase [Thermoleophilaceae bacterium]